MTCFRIPASEYEFVLVMFFATDEINKNPDLLPNTSLVFSVMADKCQDSLGNLDIQYMLINDSLNYVNYVCDIDDSCAIGLTGPSWKTSLKLAIDSWTPTVRLCDTE